MNKGNKLNLNDKIKDIVQDALKNRNFKTLNDDIKHVAKEALGEIRRPFGRQRSNQHNAYSQQYNQGKLVPKAAKLAVPVGQVSGMLFTLFGAIGSAIFGIAVMVLTLLGYFFGGRALFYTIALGMVPFFMAGIILYINGSRIRKRLKRFQKYISKMHNRNYCSITDFSSATGLSNKSTVKDLQKMIHIGMFPQGHIDDKKTCFMLDNQSYEQYIQLQEAMKLKALEEEKKQESQTIHRDFVQREKNEALSPEIRKAITQGRRFVMKIKDANIAIPGEEISLKLDRLEEVTGKIFDYVEVHPERLPEIKKFTEYFLPTTLKLLEAYSKFDYEPVRGENISSAKKEIEETMDTINLAFEKLFDGFFEEVAMDISTDISVLETMFAQEGLTENHMRVKNKTMEDENE